MSSYHHFTDFWFSIISLIDSTRPIDDRSASAFIPDYQTDSRRPSNHNFAAAFILDHQPHRLYNPFNIHSSAFFILSIRIIKSTRLFHLSISIIKSTRLFHGHSTADARSFLHLCFDSVKSICPHQWTMQNEIFEIWGQKVLASNNILMNNQKIKFNISA